MSGALQLLAAIKPATGGGGARSYWRIYVTATQTTDAYFCFIAEIEMRATLGGADQCSGGTASASTFDPTSTPPNAFDNSAATRWASQSGSTPPDWIRYQFAAPVSVAQVAIQAGGNAYTAQRAPKDFLIQSSNDGTTWTTEKTVSGGAAWGSGETRLYSVP